MDSIISSFNVVNDTESLLLFGCHVVAGLIMIVVGAQFDNHFWRLLTCVSGRSIAMALPFLHYTNNTYLHMLWWVIVYFFTLNIPHHPIYTKQTNYGMKRPFHKRQGCVFVTGCDSGMGYTTVIHLAKTNNNSSDKDNRYEIIFAGCFNVNESRIKYEKELGKDMMDSGLIQLVELNVVGDKSVENAVKVITKIMKDKNVKIGLTSLVQFHGIAYTGPAQYMPLDMYKKQFEVNTLGTYRVVQAILPLIRNRCNESSEGMSIHDVVGRIILTGTGVGPISPCPPLLSAYMGSKFALEAYRQCLDCELYMLNLNIQTSMINPGIVKPTMMPAEGMKLVTAMYNECQKRCKGGSNIAKDEYGVMHNHFINYQTAEPGTHVSQIALAAEHGLTAMYPRSSYKVGIDSKLGAIVGMFPTGARNFVFLNGIYGFLSPVGRVKGYKV